MGFWSSVLGIEPEPDYTPEPAPAARTRFAIGDDLATWNALVGHSTLLGRVTRAEAMRVPAVKRARDLIAGVIGTLPMHATRDPGGQRVDHALLAQPERMAGLPRVVTMTRTCEDLLFEGASLWLVVLRSSTGFPEAVTRVEFPMWTQDLETGTVWVNGREVDPADVILFTSPCDPLLVVGGPTIRALQRLEATASQYLESPEPSAYFAPSDGIDPDDPDEIERLLTDWAAARRRRTVAYVPGGLQLHSVTRTSPEDLQLNAAREFSIAEISRLTGIEPSWLGLSLSSRTYANITDERRSYTDYVLSPYLRAIEERLSMGDTTPRGHRVRASLDSFLRASTADRYAAHSTALTAGFLTVNEVRELEDRPPLDPPLALPPKVLP